MGTPEIASFVSTLYDLVLASSALPILESAIAIADSVGQSSTQSHEVTWKDKASVVSAIAAAIAAAASAYSVYQAFQERKEHAKQREKEAESRYYRTIVADPSLERIAAFRRNSHAFLQDEIQSIRSLQPEDVVLSKTRELSQEFGTMHVDAMNEISGACDAWNESDFYERVREALEEIPAEVLNPLVTELVNNSNAEIDWEGNLNRSVGKVVRIVRDFDPILYNREDPGHRSSANSNGRTNF